MSGAALMAVALVFLCSQVFDESPWQLGILIGVGAFIGGLSLYREEAIG